MTNRRDFLKAATAAASVAAPFPALAKSMKRLGHVVVVGGGYGGATAAKYLRLWSDGAVEVTLVERNPAFVSCPMSNLVIGGLKQMADITVGYDNLARVHGVKVVHDTVSAIDPGARKLTLAGGTTLGYDRLVLAPGIDFMLDRVEGLAGHVDTIPHAWKAGEQTVILRKQLEAMADGGVFAIHIPKAPYRCPPGPYERACLVAAYFKQHKPRSKVIVLDANDDIQSKKALFRKAWETHYKDILEYRPNNTLLEVDVASRSAIMDFETVKADVLNVIPPQRAGAVAGMIGSDLINGRWINVDWLTMEVHDVPRVHVVGDAAFPAPTMPKSGHMANQQAKVAAAAIIRLLEGRPPNPAPVVMNTCYSYVDPKNAVHVASVHQYDAEKRTFLPVHGAGGLSPAANQLEAKTAQSWAQNIWADMLA
ncbi:FAD-dependent oxidoreductase [Nitrogeniibacter mangrovi]|uniref:FAD-dependent oxidoreductase n=1 Tax=Nitrogeniibacter mangrovi TaxID=2016596 RepID=A0A6C1B8R0_9RHOO|nr:FAD-dependent oxidoreductase [Nitrogeniibacter mangrovi]